MPIQRPSRKSVGPGGRDSENIGCSGCDSLLPYPPLRSWSVGESMWQTPSKLCILGDVCYLPAELQLLFWRWSQSANGNASSLCAVRERRQRKTKQGCLLFGAQDTRCLIGRHPFNALRIIADLTLRVPERRVQPGEPEDARAGEAMPHIRGTVESQPDGRKRCYALSDSMQNSAQLGGEGDDLSG